MRWLELTIMLSVLAAIVSTFFLYNINTSTSLQTASVLSTVINTPKASVKDEPAPISTSSTTIATSTIIIENSAEIDLQTPAPITSGEIVVEALPLDTEYVEQLSNRIESLTTIVRSQNSLPPLKFDKTLSSVALERSVDMITANYFSHTAKDGCDVSCRFKRQQYVTSAWGENLAELYDYNQKTATIIADEFMREWLRSDTHRKNILSPNFTHFGIGIETNNDRLVATVVFAK